MSCNSECTIREFDYKNIKFTSGACGCPYDKRPPSKQKDACINDLEDLVKEYYKKPQSTDCPNKKTCKCVKYPPKQRPPWSEPVGGYANKKYEVAGFDITVQVNFKIRFRDFNGKCFQFELLFPKSALDETKKTKKVSYKQVRKETTYVFTKKGKRKKV